MVLSRHLGPRTLAAALLCAAGASTPPRGERLQGLHARIASGETFTATLAGARLEAGPQLLVGREPGRRGLPTIHAIPGQRLVWDGRFELVAEAGAVVPLTGRLARLSDADRARLSRLPAWVRPTLPAHLMPDGSAKLAEAAPLALARLHAALGFVARESDI